MILILSNTLSKRWKVAPVPISSAPPCHPALVWRADWFRIGQRRSNIICVNESSCFSFVLIDQKQMSFKNTMLNIINRIGDTLFNAGVDEERIRQGISDVLLVKHPNQQVIGTMNDQKYRYEWDFLYSNTITNFGEFERCNNAAPLGMFNMKTSVEVFAETVKQPW